MWEYLGPKFKALGIVVERITDRLREGVADTSWQMPPAGGEVYGAAGWCELKYIDKKPRAWPLVLIPWKSPAQPLFLSRWARGGGRAGVLMNVGGSKGEWMYWHARKDLAWLTEVQEAVDAEVSPTWRCAGSIDIGGLCHVLSHGDSLAG